MSGYNDHRTHKIDDAHERYQSLRGMGDPLDAAHDDESQGCCGNQTYDERYHAALFSCLRDE